MTDRRLPALVLALLCAALPLPAAAETPTAVARPAQWALAIHGGAGIVTRDRMTAAQEADYRRGLADALAAGQQLLADGGSALDAVEAAVKVLEDNPLFNAGRGAVFTDDGRNELDAAIMDGRTREAGAVAGVTRTRNPIALARAVMERSGHVMLAGPGADAWSLSAGIEQADPSWFRTPHRWEQLQDRRQRGQGASLHRPTILTQGEGKFGTVGAVARDVRGHVAAATSTGGLTAKRFGRVGDSPIIGAGTFADDRACAVSATGSGEYYIRANVAAEICARIRLAGESPQTAADTVQQDVKALGGSGGVIVMGLAGAPVWSFNTAGMYRGMAVQGSAPVVQIFGDE